MTLPEETCSLCEEKTGRAGQYDDSIYVELSARLANMNEGDEVGPLCTECFHAMEQLNLVSDK